MILFGQGGTAVEVVRDQALGLAAAQPPPRARADRRHADLPPAAGLSRPPAGRPRCDRADARQARADGGRSRPIAELDINPLLADADGRARARRAHPRSPSRREARHRPLRDPPLPEGARAQARPARTAANSWSGRSARGRAGARPAGRAADHPEDSRLRFFAVVRTLAPELCARLTQIDYEREMVLVAIEPRAARTIYSAAWCISPPTGPRACRIRDAGAQRPEGPGPRHAR